MTPTGSTAMTCRSARGRRSSPGWPRWTSPQRREVAGLHPDRAPTIIAGGLIFLAVARRFGLDRVEISEHDILRGAALGL